MQKKGHHVVPNGDKWAVIVTGAARSSGVFDTQKEAVDRARELAQSRGSEVYVHGRDGRIRERNSYGRDPAPPKG